MDIRPSPEQRQIAEAADRLARKLGPDAVGDLDDGDRRSRLEQAITQAGWRELRTGTPAEPMASGVEAAIVVRSLARRACDAAFIGPVLAGDLLRRAGRTSCEPGPTIALAGDLAGLGHAGAPLVAIDTYDQATNAQGSNDRGAVALAPAGAGAGSGIVDLPVGRSVVGVDLTRTVSAIGPEATPTERTDTAEISNDDLTGWTALAVALTAADLVGAMEGTLALATDYAEARHQYGVPIGSYQAIQHLLAEAKTLTEGAASAMTHAAWAVDALAPDDARAAAAVAKAYASRAARTVCETSIQVHGGIGNTWECMAHVFLRRALLATELFGGDGPQLALLAQQRWGATNGLR